MEVPGNPPPPSTSSRSCGRTALPDSIRAFTPCGPPQRAGRRRGGRTFVTETIQAATSDATAEPRSTARSSALTGLRLPELQTLAADLGVAGTSGMRKSDLIDAIKVSRSGGSRSASRNDAPRAEQVVRNAPEARRDETARASVAATRTDRRDRAEESRENETPDERAARAAAAARAVTEDRPRRAGRPARRGRSSVTARAAAAARAARSSGVSFSRDSSTWSRRSVRAVATLARDVSSRRASGAFRTTCSTRGASVRDAERLPPLRLTLIASIRSLLRIPDVPATPRSAARVCSSGRRRPVSALLRAVLRGSAVASLVAAWMVSVTKVLPPRRRPARCGGPHGVNARIESGSAVLPQDRLEVDGGGGAPATSIDLQSILWQDSAAGLDPGVHTMRPSTASRPPTRGKDLRDRDHPCLLYT